MDKRTAQIDRHADRWDGQACVQIGRQIDTQIDICTYKKIDEQTDGQKNRTDR